MAGYYSSIIKGVSTVMVSYSSWNGLRMHANKEMVTGFLKGTLRFRVNSSSLLEFLFGSFKNVVVSHVGFSYIHLFWSI